MFLELPRYSSLLPPAHLPFVIPNFLGTPLAFRRFFFSGESIGGRKTKIPPNLLVGCPKFVPHFPFEQYHLSSREITTGWEHWTFVWNSAWFWFCHFPPSLCIPRLCPTRPAFFCRPGRAWARPGEARNICIRSRKCISGQRTVLMIKSYRAVICSESQRCVLYLMWCGFSGFVGVGASKPCIRVMLVWAPQGVGRSSGRRKSFRISTSSPPTPTMRPVNPKKSSPNSNCQINRL